MDQGRRPLIRRSGRVWAQGMAIVCVAVLAIGAGAAAAPKADQGPPDQAQGNGPPATPQAHGNGPAAAAPQGQAKGLARKQAATTQGATQTGGAVPGNSAAGHAGAGGGGHAGPATQVTSGGQAATGDQGAATGQGGGTSQEQGAAHSRAGHVTLCHATGSAKHPWVEIKVSANAAPAQLRNQGGRTIAPSGGESPGLPQAAATNGELGNAPPAIASPQAGQDEDGDAPSGDTSSGESGTLGASDEGGSAPEAGGGVLGAEEDAGDDFGATGEASSASLPFTGLGLGVLVALGAMLALAGVYVRRRTTM